MRQRFQSFWWGEALSPYEWLCLKSFADFGHAFDLYTFDPDIVVPSGIRVCDASEVVNPSEFFAPEGGVGKGSPPAFANLFRYKLLAQKGGWWVDTDVVCLADTMPDRPEFVARLDDDVVGSAVMVFGPRHAAMIRCFELARELGRSNRWADAGPRLLTRVLKELDHMNRVHAASTCYPVLAPDALDLLRPSKLGRMCARLGGSFFLCLWNAVLSQYGVRKSYLPPRGSMLRHLVEQHRVEGWTGEYDEAGVEALLKAVAEQLEIDRRLAAERDANRRLMAERARLQDELRERVAAGDELRTELDAVLSSTSWRMTQPLRAIGRRVSRRQSTSRAAE